MSHTPCFNPLANRSLRAGLGLCLFSSLSFAETGWEEKFTVPFEPKALTTVEVIEENGRVQLADKERKTGGSNVTFEVPLLRNCPYLQVVLSDVNGEGYRGFTLKFAEQNREAGLIDGAVPGVYTVDWTEAIPASMSTGDLKLFIAAGADASEPPPLGPKFSFDSMKFLDRLEEGLIATSSGGEEVVSKGGSFHLVARTKTPVKDVTVEFKSADENGVPFVLQFSEEDPYVQLKPVGGDKRHWEATVKLNGVWVAGELKTDFKKRYGGVVAVAAIVGGSKEERPFFTPLPCVFNLRE